MPVFLQPDESPEGMFTSGSYKPLVKVLEGLRAHDEVDRVPSRPISYFVAMRDAPVGEPPVTAMVARAPDFTGSESVVDPFAELRQRMRPQSHARIDTIALRYRYDVDAEANRIRVGSTSVVEGLRGNPFNADGVSGVTVS
ncbi:MULTISPECIES: hypothetical protein [unclassified Streptomyces]|uniref:hypothetical protein n=1 Tax=unclassified Streptomyces TaxID=2593676 RepID=UPI00380A0305